MNNNGSTTFKFFGFALFFAALFFAWSMFLKPTISEEPKLSESEKTKARAERVAQQLIEMKFELTSFVEPEQKRGLASESEAVPAKRIANEGQYGRDAWGYPLQFKVNDGKVFIWSMGPNHQLESAVDDMIHGQAKGDDILISSNLTGK